MEWFRPGLSRLTRARCLRPLAAVVAIAALAATAAEPDDHEHGVGAHGGLIVALGRDSYHVEPVFEAGGILRIYLLGSDETRVQETQRQTLTAYAKPVGGREAVALPIVSEPQEGDAEGQTSRFKGTLPEALRAGPVEVTIPNLRIEGARFRVGFTSAPPPPVAMPAALADDDATKLFLTPGGRYTAADITANGRVTAQQKFRGFRAKHDANPVAGDTLCPISETKASPACTWIIGGRTYQFCCPPCVEEFVQMAKETPDAIKEPGDYVKR